MKSLRAVATAEQDPPPVTSTRALAQMVGVAPPISVSGLIDALSSPVTFHKIIETPSGTALGGTVDLTLFSDGRYSFDVHMHDGGFDPYTFHVVCVLRTPSGVAVLFQASGHTDGTGSNPFGHVNRDFHHHESGTNKLIAMYWTEVRASSLSVCKTYEDVGALQTIEDAAKVVLGFLIADVTFGAGLALVISASAQLADSLDASFVGTGGLVGVAVAGGVVWLFGPSAILAAVAAGVTAGAVTDALVKHRQMTIEEYRFATIVFGDTLPPRERFFLTNLSSGGGRCYVWPSVDHSILMNLDTAFDDPVHFPGGVRYPIAGQLFVHELAHAWQIQTKSFVPGLMCKRVFGPASYEPGNAGQPWSEYGIEQQATIVDRWFMSYAQNWVTLEDLARNLGSSVALNNEYAPYILNNIRLGQN